MKVNIIGGGLAGCALAYVLKHAGVEPVIYEASDSLASGASGNDVGLYNPRFTAFYDAIGQFYGEAFQGALKVFEEFGDSIDWNPCGAVHLINNEQKERRFGKMLQNWPPGAVEALLLSAEEASRASGVALDYQALYLPQSGTVSPKKLCQEYARGVEIHLNTNIAELPEGITVLACGMGCLNFDEASHLPLRPVRGQVSYVRATEVSKNIKTTIGFGGYVAPERGGVHCLGASFERHADHSDIKMDDNLSNLNNMFQNVKSLSGDYEIIDARAGVRTTTPDHKPVFGKLSDHVYVSAACGSHGILSSLNSAKKLSDFILKDQEISPLFCPQRFN